MDAFNATMARRVRAERKFSFGFNAILPVQSPLKKYSPSRLTQITSIFAPIPPHSGGRIAIVREGGGEAVDGGGVSDEGANSGRRSRVVLTPRRWRKFSGGNPT